MTAKELRDKRAEVAKSIIQMRDLASNPEHDWTDENEQSWTKANDEYNQLSRRLEKVEQAEAIEKEQGERQEQYERAGREDKNARGREGSDDPVKDQAIALQAWMRTIYSQPLTDEHREACERLGVNPYAKEFEIVPNRGFTPDKARREAMRQNRELRTTDYTSTASGHGGEFVPPGDLYSRIEVAMLAFGGVRGVSTVIQTSAGAPLIVPTSNDTSNKGALLGEVQDSGDSAVADTNLTTDDVTLQAYKFTSNLVRVSAELLQDSAFDLVSFIGETLGTRIARGQNDYFTTGTGNGQPSGIVTGATVGKVATGTTTIDADELIDLLHSVDPAYRASARFMANDAVFAVIRKLKDSDGQYLWQPGLQLGIPDRLLGFPTVVNQSMASSLAANAVAVLFGDLSKYFIRDAGGIRLRRLVERYAEYDQEGFVAFRRSDGALIDAGTRPVKFLQMAAS